MDRAELRMGIPAEIRADGDTIKVSGYAAVFNEVADIGGYFQEVISPGAFSRAIEEDDVLFLVNHAGLPLARTRSGTLDLEEDEKGLRIETELDPEDPDVQAIVPKMKRGDLDKMSFAFYPVVQEWDDSGEVPLRTLKEVSLEDVSIVNKPAYDSTEIGLRSLEEFRSQVSQDDKDKARKNFQATRRRKAMENDLALKEKKLPKREKGD